jgi:sarcosine oxidase, subunit gamma
VTAEARSPLAHRAADLAAIDAVEVAFLAQVDVRCDRAHAVSLGFPLEANTVSGDMARGALWLGPDEWLVVGLPGTAPAIAAEVDATLAGAHHSVVDVSANRAVIELGGPRRHDVLATGCGLDLDPRRGWTAGRCAQTLFARAQVVLQELDGATRVFVRPSFGDYVVDRLGAGAATLRA